MTIAIDYDDTYTRDPDYWDAVIALGHKHGHNFVCVTQRPWRPQTERVPMLSKTEIPFVCAGEEFKVDAARAAGYRIAIWIDDNPQAIGRNLEIK